MNSRVTSIPEKAQAEIFIDRFREIISDPLNLLIDRVPMAGVIKGLEVCLHNGIIVPIAGDNSYYGPFSQILALNRGVHEPVEEFVFQQTLKKIRESSIMLELGAYWGHYSMWFKKRIPNGRAILVEPEKKNLDAGIINFKKII